MATFLPRDQYGNLRTLSMDDMAQQAHDQVVAASAPPSSDSLTDPLGLHGAAASPPLADVAAPSKVQQWEPIQSSLPTPSDSLTNPPPSDLVEYAKSAAAKAGIDPDQFVRQINQESGFNPKAGSRAGAQGIAQIVPKWHPGVDPWDPRASLDYAANLMAQHKKTYGRDDLALVAYNGGQGAVDAWNSGKAYQESQTYVSKILTKAGIDPYPKGVTTQTPTTSKGRTSQFALGLSDADAYAACGPAAAIAFAQRYGRNPTGSEALDLAKSVGWTREQGMAGVQSEQKLLEKMGVKTKLENGVNWQHVQSDANSGNPVIIDTPGHYFYVDGYDPQKGYHVGTSGTDLKGSGEWMTPDQMAARMGSPRAALYADNPSSPEPSVASAPSAPTQPWSLDSLAELAHSKVNDASKAAGGVKDTVESLVDAARQKVSEASNAVADTVNSMNPLEAAKAYQDIQTKYGGGLQPKPGGGVKWTNADYTNATPEEKSTLANATMAVGGVSNPVTKSSVPGSKLDDILTMHANQDVPAPNTLTRSSVGQWIERQVSDKYADLNRLGSDVEEKVALFQGRMGAAEQRTEEAIKPVLQTAGADLPYLNAYRKAQVDLERLTAKGSRAASAGVDDVTAAQATLQDIEQRLGPARFAKLQQADQQLQSSLDTLLQDKVDAGLVKQSVADQLRTVYPHYNPVRVLEAIDDGTLGATGKKLSQNTSLLKRLTDAGSEADTEQPVRSAIRALVEGDIAIRRNDAATTIANAVVSQGLGKKVSTIALKTGPDIANAGQTATIATKKIGDVPGTISYFTNGQRQLVSVPPEIDSAVKALADPALGGISRIAMAANAPLRKGATTLNPFFIPANAVADAITTFVREGVSATARIPVGYIHAARQDSTYQAFIRAGGGMEGYFTKSPANVQKAIAQSGGVTITGNTSWLNFLRKVNPIGAVEKVGGIVEMGPRLGTFSAHLAQGDTEAQAALAGRRVTVDFSRSGQAVRTLNAWVPFLNARVQGTLQVGRTLRDSNAARIRLAALSGLVGATYAWNHQYKEEWADIPDYIKDQYAVVILGHGEPDPSGVGFKSIPYVAVPLREWAIPAATLLHTFGQIDKTDPRAWPDFAASQLRNFTPISGDTALSGVGGLAPAPLRYLAENQANTRFYSGSPIVGKQYENTPPTEQYDDRTGVISKAIAQKLGWSPKGLDFLLQENLGGVGKLIAGQPLSLTRTQGGQTVQHLYDQYDQRVNATQEKLADLVKASPEYQRATRDRQIQLEVTAQTALRTAAKLDLGIPSPARDTGLPNKYIGVTDPQQTKQIDSALAAYRSWQADPRHAPRPPSSIMSLAQRYDGRTNPAYSRVKTKQEQDNRSVGGLLRQLPDVAKP